jgi:dsRNA-specific ribonuclease
MTFTVEVRLSNGATERAQAGSKRLAEESAAEVLLRRLAGAPA